MRRSAEIEEVFAKLLEDILPSELGTSPSEIRQFFLSNVIGLRLAALIGKVSNDYKVIRSTTDGALKVALGNASGLGPDTWFFTQDTTYSLGSGLDESVRVYPAAGEVYGLKGIYFAAVAPTGATGGTQRVDICSYAMSSWGCRAEWAHSTNVEVRRYNPVGATTLREPSQEISWVEVIRDIWGDADYPIEAAYWNLTDVAQTNMRRYTLSGIRYMLSL